MKRKMPVLEIDTNVAQEKITPELVQEITKLLSEMLDLEISVRMYVHPCRGLTSLFP